MNIILQQYQTTVATTTVNMQIESTENILQSESSTTATSTETLLQHLKEITATRRDLNPKPLQHGEIRSPKSSSEP
jgi:hypothetical protein